MAQSLTPICALCRRVSKALHPDTGLGVPSCYDINGNRDIRLGSWQELRMNKTCRMCCQVVHGFNTAPNPEQRALIEEGDYVFHLLDADQEYFWLRLSAVGVGTIRQITIEPLDHSLSVRGGMIVGPEVNISFILKWLNTCDTEHLDCKQRIRNGYDPRSDSQRMMLISIHEECLVDSDGSERYAALSYVWGTDSSNFSTTRSNVTALRLRGSLASQKIQSQIPGTVRRAIQLSALINIPFLWVDRLCIMQDDPAHVSHQINRMGTIFENSHLTLCAKDANEAEMGLRGLPESSLPRHVPQQVFSFDNDSLATKWVQTPIDRTCIYGNRGWTLQEEVLAHRTLSFTNEGLEWRCRTIRASESCSKILRNDRSYARNAIDLEDTLWPCLKKWDNLYNDFRARDIKDEGDAIRAFSGILEILENPSIGPFHFGLPEKFFDAALLWLPGEYLTRREVRNRGNGPLSFPSWAPSGWRGLTRSQINAFGTNYIRSNPLFSSAYNADIEPTTTWYKEDITTGDRLKIINNYALLQDHDPNDPLPQGWSFVSDDETGDRYYTCSKAPAGYTFWYPLPDWNQEIDTVLCRQWSTTLFAKTSRSYLFLGGQLVTEELKLVRLLVSTDGTSAGIIYCHFESDYLSEGPQKCELIVVSSGFALLCTDASEYVPEISLFTTPGSSEWYSFYHVLWIEWHGPYATRRGLGRVEQSMWDSMQNDNIEVQLQ